MLSLFPPVLGSPGPHTQPSGWVATVSHVTAQLVETFLSLAQQDRDAETSGAPSFSEMKRRSFLFRRQRKSRPRTNATVITWKGDKWNRGNALSENGSEM